MCGGARCARCARAGFDRCARFGGARAVCRAGYTHTHHTHRSYTPHHNARRGRRDELGRTGRGAAAGVPGHEARRALPFAMSAAHCSGVKVPFHSAPAPVDGITPSRSSPSRYVPRSEGSEVGARSKLRFLSPAAGGVVGAGRRAGARRRGGARELRPRPLLPNLVTVGPLLSCAQLETRLRRPLLEGRLHLRLRGSMPAGGAEGGEGTLRHREPRDAGMRAARRRVTMRRLAPGRQREESTPSSRRPPAPCASTTGRLPPRSPMHPSSCPWPQVCGSSGAAVARAGLALGSAEAAGGQPAGQPCGQPGGQPSGQPSGQPRPKSG